MNIGHFYKHWI